MVVSGRGMPGVKPNAVRLDDPVSVDAVISPPAPTFTVATANTPVPFAPGIFTMPSPLGVAARATMSGVGVVDADSSSVLRPTITAADPVFAQLKLNATSVGSNGALGVIEMTKV